VASTTAGAADRSLADRQIVFVVGPGRSGTSTVAGTLARCGFEVPGRAIRGNRTNPSGFYEPRWVVDFHREQLKRLKVGTIDASPRAIEIVTDAMSGSEAEETLRTWLSERLEKQPRLVVKDPRSIWFLRVWTEMARELDASTGFVTMLRHPAEVSASRQRYYHDAEVAPERAEEIARIAGWVNGLLVAELISRSTPRAFVRYDDLLEDWRAAMRPVAASLGLDLNPPIDQRPHPVDEFIDPSLHRVVVGWPDDVPAQLRDVAEGVWKTLSRFAGAGATGTPAELISEADRLRSAYGQLFTDAQALTRSATMRARLAARRRGYAKAQAEEVPPSVWATVRSRLRTVVPGRQS